MMRIACPAVFLLFLAAACTLAADARPRHPAIRLLDRDERSVIESGLPVSTMATCNGCHRTDYIATHCYHTRLGGGDLDPTGARNVGGAPGANTELNCFLCHLSAPDDQARRAMLAAGCGPWASTATLASAGLVERQGSDWKYRRDAFRSDGRIDPERLAIRPPTSGNCGLCHGQTYRGEEPLRLDITLQQWKTATTGTIFAPQRIADSAANLPAKQHLARSWDVHAERLLECAQCHFSLNHPAYYDPTPRSRPEHLRFEPRRMALDEYLARPSHQFARGESSHVQAASHLDGTMRRCADCHASIAGHDWLPYRATHFEKLSCEACHIPQAYAPAVQCVDWGLIGLDGQPRLEWRGVEGDPAAPDALITGFTPVLLPRRELDGAERLYPYNLLTQWRWVEGQGHADPVPQRVLQAALLQNGHYHPALLAVFDTNHDGTLSAEERRLDTPAKMALVRARLTAVGAGQPRLIGRIEPYALHHGVGAGRFALRDCQECHARDSRLSRPLILTAAVAADAVPQPAAESNVRFAGTTVRTPAGQMAWQPAAELAGVYVLGANRQQWIDRLGSLALLGVLGAVAVHGGLRIAAARKLRNHRENPSS